MPEVRAAIAAVDPTLAAVAVGLAAVAVMACLIPAWQTLDIDAVRVLRQERP